MTEWATKKKIKDSKSDDNDGDSTINLIFGTGVTYLNYLWTKSFHFVVHEDLAAVQEIHRSVFGRNSKTLFFTSLKILSSPGAATSAGTSSGPTESQSVRPSNDNEASNVAEDEHSRDRTSGVDVSRVVARPSPVGVQDDHRRRSRGRQDSGRRCLQRLRDDPRLEVATHSET